MTRLLSLFVCSIPLFLAGCGEAGPPLGTVSGTVMLDGKAMPNMMVVFTPKAGGQNSTAKTNSEGKYELVGATSKGALIGLHTVSITTLAETSAAVAPTEMSSDSAEYAAQGDPSQYKKAAQFKELVPERYNTKSELIEEVKSGANTINFDLKSK